MPNDQIIVNEGGLPANQETYDAVRSYIVTAQKQVNAAVNSAMVTAYWNIVSRFMKHVEKTNVPSTGRTFCNTCPKGLRLNSEKVLQ